MTHGPSSNGERPRRPAARRAAASAASAARAAAEAEFASLLRQVALHVKALFEKAGELAALRWRRLKLRAVDGAFTAIFAVAALVTGVTLLVAAALLVVAGLDHALARWSGAEWVGELGGGAIALALPGLALWFVRWRTRRALLAKALARPVVHAPSTPVAPRSPP